MRFYSCVCGLPGWLNVKNLPANAGDTGDVGSIPGLGRSLQEEMATRSSILAGKIPWTEEPGGLQPMGSQSGWTRLREEGLETRMPGYWRRRELEASSEGANALCQVLSRSA